MLCCINKCIKALNHIFCKMYFKDFVLLDLENECQSCLIFKYIFDVFNDK